MAINYKLECLNDWNVNIGKTFLVAGPCSAESELQLMQTAVNLKKCGISVFRAGIWKPRTMPGHFEGVGLKGLIWLQNVRKTTNLRVAVEVATPEHVEQCLKHDIDILWIGARTTANPFYIQAIADTLKGIHIPVMVKNPINPDIDLWIGALNRLNRAGIKKLAAVHRGFSTFDKEIYRNKPMWNIPIELRRRIPEVPIICDPSHICGRVDLLFSVAQKALDLAFDGLMIETHINPETALSDANQQITPDELADMINNLNFKKESIDNFDLHYHIYQLRKHIDEIDEEIIELVSDRMSIAKKIGEYKRGNNIAIFQRSRWNEIVQSRVELGQKMCLSKDFILKIYQNIHEEAIRHQENGNFVELNSKGSN